MKKPSIKSGVASMWAGAVTIGGPVAIKAANVADKIGDKAAHARGEYLENKAAAIEELNARSERKAQEKATEVLNNITPGAMSDAFDGTKAHPAEPFVMPQIH